MRYESRVTRYGYTLAEAMLAVVIVGAAASGVLLPFAGGAAVRAEGQHRTLAAKLANDLIEQIVNTPFDRIMATYNGYSEPQGQIKDATGAVFADVYYVNFSRNVSCQQGSGAVASKFILVTVRVYYRGQELVSINRLVSK